MKRKNTAVSIQTTVRRLGYWALAVAAVLLIPKLTNSPWTTGDFMFAGTVLFGSATVYEMVTRTMENKTHRLLVGAAVLTVVVLIWAWAVA